MQVVSSTGSTTLTAAITTTGQTAISLANSQNMAAGVVIQVQTELMQITAIAGLNLTVTRGFNGTAAATHTSGTTVTIMAAIAMGTLLNSTTARAGHVAGHHRGADPHRRHGLRQQQHGGHYRRLGPGLAVHQPQRRTAPH